MSDRERSAESVRPVFVDNRDGNRLARAITTHLAALRRDGRTPAELCVASERSHSIRRIRCRPSTRKKFT